ncbi:2-nitropropane dioxygenase [Rhodococcus sp. SRB_17]|uniref:NAD(P)H-dependent flavin oxidoreductase n=1 Tax=Rhodococcus sp. OK302 TaxID=1882769 RepID=UPI000B944378|nr:nitronate monooxygenase family protein [Rhodococcus sp. OK302]NMM89092.1 2-nitropropane dioxygenase [Rhodococcus sp. SRB_17]OYD66930.1 nitronate monooxygenase [Rhodococcus sp. OK302]
MTTFADLTSQLRVPVLASPMFIVSTPDLVIAQCTAGIIGSFPALNARPQSALHDWLKVITTAREEHDREHPESPSAPFAVNLIVHRSNDRLKEDLATIVEFEVPIVITSLGARTDINDAVHAYGGIVLHDVIDNHFARKAVEKGADGLVAVATGAGGHAGRQSPFALIQEIRGWFTGPLLLSGAIAHGNSILAALAAGADLAYVGSAFIATEEANADPSYKQMIVESRASDIVYSNLFTGVHGNYLRGSIEAAGLDPENLAESDPSAMSFATTDSNTKAWRDIWGAGQGIGTVNSVVPTRTLVERLTTEFDAARERICRR